MENKSSKYCEAQMNSKKLSEIENIAIIIFYVFRWLESFYFEQKRGSHTHFRSFVNPLSADPTKWSNTLKQFVGNLPTNCLSVFNHFCEIGA